jgi:hypothetical protein
VLTSRILVRLIVNFGNSGKTRVLTLADMHMAIEAKPLRSQGYLSRDHKLERTNPSFHNSVVLTQFLQLGCLNQVFTFDNP